jgi:hypothetical protein
LKRVGSRNCKFPDQFRDQEAFLRAGIQPHAKDDDGGAEQRRNAPARRRLPIHRVPRGGKAIDYRKVWLFYTSRSAIMHAICARIGRGDTL